MDSEITGKAPEEDPPPDYKPAAGDSRKANYGSGNSAQLEDHVSNPGPESSSPSTNNPNTGLDDKGFNPCGCFQRCCCWGDCTLQRGCYAVGLYHLIMSVALLVTVGEIYILNETARVEIAEMFLPVGVLIFNGMLITGAACLLHKTLCIIYLICHLVYVVAVFVVLILYALDVVWLSVDYLRRRSDLSKVTELVIVFVLYSLFLLVDVYCAVCGVALFLQIRRSESARSPNAISKSSMKKGSLDVILPTRSNLVEEGSHNTSSLIATEASEKKPESSKSTGW